MDEVIIFLENNYQWLTIIVAVISIIIAALTLNSNRISSEMDIYKQLISEYRKHAYGFLKLFHKENALAMHFKIENMLFSIDIASNELLSKEFNELKVFISKLILDASIEYQQFLILFNGKVRAVNTKYFKPCEEIIENAFLKTSNFY